MNRSLSIFLFSLALTAFSCKKESFITGSNASISLSADSLHFDTLFTTTGSVTQSFKLYNTNKQKLHISRIAVGGGGRSNFSINADGFQGPEVRDIEMEANDSIYVFVTVRIDPSLVNLAYIVQDSIQIQFNGNEQWVQLDAWGQNANFLRSGIISSNTTWTNKKPYVILGGLQVRENAVLTIEKGTKIYLHADAPFLVDGTVKAAGEQSDSMEIVFQGDRLDDPYRSYPAAWPGIYFREKSKNNILKHVSVKNANQGIVVQGRTVNNNPKLSMDKCIIDNCYEAGVIGTQTDIDMVNCLISNCGKNIALTNGGNYSLTYCTVAAYSNSMISHKDPVLMITNFGMQDNTVSVSALTASIRNCIFWGDNGVVDNEVEVGQEGTETFNVDFQNCLWKETDEPVGVTLSGIVANQDPLFQNTDARNGGYNFHPEQDSPAGGAGKEVGIGTDLDENSRNPDFPDIGAYEVSF